MFVTPEIIADAERLYGAPIEKCITAPLKEDELDFIKKTQKRGREHDITMLIFNDAGEIAVMNKNGYPAELYRPPSGGLEPDESFTAGGKREAFEETGLDIELTKYLLRVTVDFKSATRSLPWYTHVFTANALTTEIYPQDTKEICKARWAPLSVFDEFREQVKQYDRGGIQYRRMLHEEILLALKLSTNKSM
ncbi:NUDIX hydrolase [Gemmatimonas aurantiaca]|nr:NUDIX hydrolase [Gemmatimonas aurantiaca]